jgi:hypothetical protein
MPWNATDALKERTKFALEQERRWDEAEGGPVNMAELCRLSGISRQTGYTWLARSREATTSRGGGRPLSSAHDVTERDPAGGRELIVAQRKRYPKWGPASCTRDSSSEPRAPRAECERDRRDPRASWSDGSTAPAATRPSAGAVAPFSGCDEPNSVWCTRVRDRPSDRHTWASRYRDGSTIWLRWRSVPGRTQLVDAHRVDSANRALRRRPAPDGQHRRGSATRRSSTGRPQTVAPAL